MLIRIKNYFQERYFENIYLGSELEDKLKIIEGMLNSRKGTLKLNIMGLIKLSGYSLVEVKIQKFFCESII